MSDGHLGFCKSCTRARVKSHRERNLEAIRAYDRERGYRLYSEEKARARAEVYNALRRGDMKKGNCWCGDKGQAHHPDYSKPLEVVWLCYKHHGAEHVKINESALHGEIHG